MSTLRLALAIALAGAALSLFSGCATTRISVTTPEGVRVSVSLPKNMDATGLWVKAGEYELRAARLITDASGVVREKNVGVSAVAGAVSDAAKAFAPTP